MTLKTIASTCCNIYPCA